MVGMSDFSTPLEMTESVVEITMGVVEITTTMGRGRDDRGHSERSRATCHRGGDDYARRESIRNRVNAYSGKAHQKPVIPQKQQYPVKTSIEYHRKPI